MQLDQMISVRIFNVCIQDFSRITCSRVTTECSVGECPSCDEEGKHKKATQKCRTSFSNSTVQFVRKYMEMDNGQNVLGVFLCSNWNPLLSNDSIPRRLCCICFVCITSQ